jgi:ribonuclease D
LGGRSGAPTANVAEPAAVSTTTATTTPGVHPAGLVEEVLSCNLPKPQPIRLGNWERKPLSSEQQHYAAMDAHACLLLHWELLRLPTTQTLSQQLIENMQLRAAADEGV